MSFVNIKLGSPFFMKVFNFLIILILVYSCLVSSAVVDRIHLVILKIVESNTGQMDLLIHPS